MNEFTLGVEEEFMVIDPVSRELKSHEQKIVDGAQKILEDQVKAEMHQAVVEVGTHSTTGRGYGASYWCRGYASLFALAAPTDNRPPTIF
jgi:hypothetical protein